MDHPTFKTTLSSHSVHVMRPEGAAASYILHTHPPPLLLLQSCALHNQGAGLKAEIKSFMLQREIQASQNFSTSGVIR